MFGWKDKNKQKGAGMAHFFKKMKRQKINWFKSYLDGVFKTFNCCRRFDILERVQRCRRVLQPPFHTPHLLIQLVPVLFTAHWTSALR